MNQYSKNDSHENSQGGVHRIVIFINTGYALLTKF